jgi:hypothetical protein
MKRRPKTPAERRSLARRHRLRHTAALDTGTASEPGGVSATVLFTDTSRTGEPAAWLEPDGRLNRTCGDIQY